MEKKSLKKFFRGKKILITGHTGFKGAWLAQILLNWDAKICGCALTPNTNPNLFNILNLKDYIEHHQADIRNFHQLNRIVKKFKPDIIFHLAAQALVRNSYDNPRSTYTTNVIGTINVLEAIRLNNIRAGIIITTDKVYQDLEKNVAFKEDDRLGGYDPYSNSKACADLAVNSHIHSFFNFKDNQAGNYPLVASARSGNVIGGGDWNKDRLLPDLIRAFFINNQNLVIRSPDAIRPWQYVLEPLRGYLLLAQSLYEGHIDKMGPWNFGPQDESMLDVVSVVNMAIDFLKKGSFTVSEDSSKHETKILKLDNSKAIHNLKWKPKLNVAKAIRETLLWYKTFYLNKIDMQAYTTRQINRYFNIR